MNEQLQKVYRNYFDSFKSYRTCLLQFQAIISLHLNWPWGPSGLSRHVSNSSRDRGLGPRFESRLRHVYLDKFVWLQFAPALM